MIRTRQAGRAGGTGLAVLTLSASLLLLACDDGDPVFGAGGGGSGATQADQLVIVGGVGQNGRTAEALPEPLVVQAVVRDTLPVEGAEISWEVTRGVATLSTAASITGPDGLASVSVTPGPLLGEVGVTARLAGESGATAEFTILTTVVLIDVLINGFEVPLGGDSLEVVLGDTIEWVNRDVLKHAVESTSVPAGGFGFQSGDLDNSERFRFVPKAEGLYVYADPLSSQPETPSGRISVVGLDTGALRVATSTTGTNPDPGYVVTVDGVRSSAIGSNDVIVFPALAATTHSARLLEVLPNCTVAGSNPRVVAVVARDTVSTAFGVACE